MEAKERTVSFTTYDFTESLSRENIDRKDIKRVVAAHGSEGDCSEWSGGFLMEMNSGKFIYITGWCDTTGWGCQDGTDRKEYEVLPDLATLEKDSLPEWDTDPADLNKYIATGEGEW
jgi:hypothetical protein